MYPLITQVIYTVVIQYIDGYTVKKPAAKKLDPIYFFYSFTQLPVLTKTWHTRLETTLTPKTSYLMIKSESEMRPVMLRALTLILEQSKQPLNPAKLKVNAIVFEN